MALCSIELFAGGGGLALGLERACGARAVCFVEREAYAAAVLAARMEDGSLAPAPIWSDVRTFDGRPWRGVVDLVAGGFPCQDISNAGLRAGIDGERSGLWSQFERIVREVGPEFVFVENVAALVVRGLDRVLGDLAALGFDAEWGVFRACEAGAPHARPRLFLLAYAHRFDGETGLGARGGAVPDHRPRAVLDRWGTDPERAEGYFTLRLGTQPCGHGVADGLADRVDRLRVLGNGVVPNQAALAFRVLWGRLMKKTTPEPPQSAGEESERE